MYASYMREDNHLQVPHWNLIFIDHNYLKDIENLKLRLSTQDNNQINISPCHNILVIYLSVPNTICSPHICFVRISDPY